MKGLIIVFNVVGTVDVAATLVPFIADINLAFVREEVIVPLKVWSIFREEFMKNDEPAFEGSTLDYGNFSEWPVEEAIVRMRGGERSVETSFSEIFSLLAKQMNGEEGPLLTNGMISVFFIRSRKTKNLVAVFLFYIPGHRWVLNGKRLSEGFTWPPEALFFFRVQRQYVQAA